MKWKRVEWVSRNAKKSDLEEGLNILKTARKIISSPDHWTTGLVARSIFGKSIDPQDDKAFSFSSRGSIIRSCKDLGVSKTNLYPFHIALTALQDTLGSITRWNDRSTHEEVLKRFDDKIAKLEKYIAYKYPSGDS